MRPITPSDWQVIRDVFRRGFASSFHFAVASVAEDGSPHVTPIGSLVLRDQGRGVYFEEYPRNLPRNLARDPRVCVLAVDASRWALLRTLARGKVTRPFGVRLYGTAGERRPATPEEVGRVQRRVSRFRLLRGHQILWGRLRMVRDVRFHGFEPIRIPQLGSAQWPEESSSSQGEPDDAP